MGLRAISVLAVSTFGAVKLGTGSTGASLCASVAAVALCVEIRDVGSELVDYIHKRVPERTAAPSASSSREAGLGQD